MVIPVPAKTPDPNIDSPTIPPTEPEPVPAFSPTLYGVVLVQVTLRLVLTLTLLASTP